jgi:hypothetical protein
MIYLRANLTAWKPITILARGKYKQTHKDAEQGNIMIIHDHNNIATITIITVIIEVTIIIIFSFILYYSINNSVLK